MSATDGKFYATIPNFRQKKGMILHENCLSADDSHEISCLICYFWKMGKICNCRLLQIIGGALRVNCMFWQVHTELLRYGCYSKTSVKLPLSRRPKMVFKTDYRLMRIKSIAACTKRSIMQYVRPSLSYQLSLRDLFCLFLSGRLTQVLLYMDFLTSPVLSCNFIK